MNIKTKEGARNKGNPYFLRVPWNKGGLVNTGPGELPTGGTTGKGSRQVKVKLNRFLIQKLGYAGLLCFKMLYVKSLF